MGAGTSSPRPRPTRILVPPGRRGRGRRFQNNLGLGRRFALEAPSGSRSSASRRRANTSRPTTSGSPAASPVSRGPDHQGRGGAAIGRRARRARAMALMKPEGRRRPALTRRSGRVERRHQSDDDVRVVVVDDVFDARGARRDARDERLQGLDRDDGAAALELVEAHQRTAVLTRHRHAGNGRQRADEDAAHPLRRRHRHDRRHGREHDDERVSDTFARVDHYLQKPVDPDVCESSCRRSTAKRG